MEKWVSCPFNGETGVLSFLGGKYGLYRCRIRLSSMIIRVQLFIWRYSAEDAYLLFKYLLLIYFGSGVAGHCCGFGSDSGWFPEAGLYLPLSIPDLLRKDMPVSFLNWRLRYSGETASFLAALLHGNALAVVFLNHALRPGDQGLTSCFPVIPRHDGVKQALLCSRPRRPRYKRSLWPPAAPEPPAHFSSKVMYSRAVFRAVHRNVMHASLISFGLCT